MLFLTWLRKEKNLVLVMKNKTFRVRAVADTEEDIFIDFLANADCNLLKVHQLFLNSFQLGENEMASFYISNNNWDKGEEITLLDMGIGNEETKSMEKTTLRFLAENNVTKLLYLHDFLNLNIFYLEILSEHLNDLNNDIQITHKLGEYIPKTFNENQSFDNIDNTLNDLEDYEDNNFGDFEQLDEDLY